MNVPDIKDWGDEKLAVPEALVTPDAVAWTTPLQEPATVAPAIAFPALSLIVTAAAADTAVVELLEERTIEFTKTSLVTVIVMDELLVKPSLSVTVSVTL